jgi:DNA mismatch repair protein MutS
MAGKETPLMKQYHSIKAQYPGAILLFRVGDFYETFDEDAVKASKVLGIVLTKRSNGAASEMNLAGFPHHSLDTYLPKLVKAGYRVAICDQLEDPKKTKTIVKRGVTELVTPGVTYNDKVLEQQESNYLAALSKDGPRIGLSLLDISTGEFYAAEGSWVFIKKLISGFRPAELLFPKNEAQGFIEELGTPRSYQVLDPWVTQGDYAYERVLRQLQVSNLKGFGLDGMSQAATAAGCILHYLEMTHHHHTSHINRLARLEEDRYVWLDAFTIRNLELLHSVYPGGTGLLDSIDHSKTPMGSRLLRKWLVLPLRDQQQIQQRLDAVEDLQKQAQLGEWRSLFEGLGDMERLASKIALRRINPKELLHLSSALKKVEQLSEHWNQSSGRRLQEAAGAFPNSQNLQSLIDAQISEEAPAVFSKGHVFQSECHPELNELRDLATHGKERLVDIQKRESEATGIPSLKIGFNNVFGYYLEVTHAHKDKVPETWIRKQTLTNAERYITPELKEYEEKILSAQDRISALESELWELLLNDLLAHVEPIRVLAQQLAEWDCLMGFAHLAIARQYCKPEIHDGLDIELIESRHPVIEQQLKADQHYVPNNLAMGPSHRQIMILTGPNMSGKSAILRQTALCVVLAQMGSFVPCRSAKIGLVDKIYTRVGASDNLSLGESTFMVEMSETASILNNLSERSLVLLDEIGRGTSTYDGVSLAWAIAEYLQSHPSKPKTLFATHYHELNELEAKLEGVQNFHIEVLEKGQQIIFLRTLKPGGSEHSFGIHVAQLAGIPNQVLIRASELLAELEQTRSAVDRRKTMAKTDSKSVYQLNMFQAPDPRMEQLKKELQSLDINELSPIEALLKLQAIKKISDEAI